MEQALAGPQDPLARALARAFRKDAGASMEPWSLPVSLAALLAAMLTLSGSVCPSTEYASAQQVVSSSITFSLYCCAGHKEAC